ncbi:MAG: hypothetical protein AABX30_02545 [Nanoarchaeota archaeon]
MDENKLTGIESRICQGLTSLNDNFNDDKCNEICQLIFIYAVEGGTNKKLYSRRLRDAVINHYITTRYANE